jgi:hypothetical protein
MNSPVIEHNAPEMGREPYDAAVPLPHATPAVSTYETPPCCAYTNSQHSLVSTTLGYTIKGIRWRASGVSDTRSWQVVPTRGPCEKSKLMVVPAPSATPHVQNRTLHAYQVHTLRQLDRDL